MISYIIDKSLSFNFIKSKNKILLVNFEIRFVLIFNDNKVKIKMNILIINVKHNNIHIMIIQCSCIYTYKENIKIYMRDKYKQGNIFRYMFRNPQDGVNIVINIY